VKKRHIGFFLIFLIALCVVRLTILLPTAAHNYEGLFRWGTHPVNDGLIWLNSAQEIIEHRQCDGRPLLPLILSFLILLFKNNFVPFFIFFVLLNIASIITACYLLEDIRNNIFIVAFLALVSLWNVPFQLSICTENLATPFMIIAFALLIKSFSRRSYTFLVFSYFFIALAQTIRPWDFFSLITLPAFPLVYSGFSRKAIKSTILLFLAMIMGISFHIVTGRIFSSGQSEHVFALHFWSQTHGGRRELIVYRLDPEVAQATLDNLPSDEKLFANGLVNSPSPATTKALMKNALRELREHPKHLLQAFWLTLVFFLRDLPYNFVNHKIGHMLAVLLIFFILFVYFYDREKIRDLAQKRILFLFFPVGAALFLWPVQVCMALAAIGLIYLTGFATKEQRVFIFLYVCGIMISLLFLGGGGGDREWLSKEALLFYCAAYGIYALSCKFKPEHPDKIEFSFDRRGFMRTMLPLYMCIFLLCILIPACLRFTQKHTGPTAPFSVTKEQLSERFAVPVQQIVAPKELVYYAMLWPNPSFETISGAYCYWTCWYRDWNTFDFEADVGTAKNHSELWPLRPFPFPRTVDIYNRLVFPFLMRKDLARLQGKQIVVFGRILGVPRQTFTTTGYLIIAQYIGYLNKAGILEWHDLNEFQ
jgi:hypothetical protein